MKTVLHRPWTAQCEYEGKKQFYLGTVVEPLDTPHNELLEKFAALWERISPHPMPRIVSIIPGALVFVPDEGDAS